MKSEGWNATLPWTSGEWSHEDQFRLAVGQSARNLRQIVDRGPLGKHDIPLFAVLKDESLLLPAFLAHYRALGVARFVLVDNGSEDGSFELLANEPDVDLWLSRASYAESCDGRMWIDNLVQRYACGRWAVFVDIDEFLVFPAMDVLRLRGLAQAIGRVGESRLLAPLVDIYSDQPILATIYEKGADPLAVCPFFDPFGYTWRWGRLGTLIVGGPRPRLFRHKSVNLFTLTKHPFEYCTASTLHPSTHLSFPFQQNPTFARGALLHVKLIAEVKREADDAIRTGEHWRGSVEYQAYKNSLTADPNLTAWTAESRRYEAPESLVDTGLVAAPAWRRQWRSIPHDFPRGEQVVEFPPDYAKRFPTVGVFQRAADRAARNLRRIRSVSSSEGPAVLISVVRNEALLLPAFLDHYRQLGICHFIMVDNGSSDGTLELLANAPDVELYSTSASYAAAVHGRLWIDGLLRARAMHRWILHVDADEFLVFDGMETHKLDELILWLEQRGEKRMFAPMLDMYPLDIESGAAFRPGMDPLEVSPYFDPIGYETRLTRWGPLVTGGCRDRLFRPLHGRLTIELSKHPLMYWDEQCSHAWNHAPHPYAGNRAVPLAWLLHFKFLGDIRARFATLVEEGQHWGAARVYRKMADDLTGGSPEFRNEQSGEYGGPASLVAAGLLHPIDWAQEFEVPTAAHEH